MFIKFEKFFHFSFFSDDIDFSDLSFSDIQLENNYEDDENSFNIRLSCFLHTLQLCVRDGLKNSTHIPRLLKKMSSIF